MIKTGTKAPEFDLQNQDDSEVSLSDYIGKWIVLYFQPKDNTSGGTREASDFTESLKDYEKLDAVIIGISPDSMLSHKNFIKKHSMGITVLSDSDKNVHKTYGAWGVKKTMVKNTNGLLDQHL